MLSLFWAFIFSFSIFIAGIIALVRFKKINKVYYPFLVCIWLACANELLTLILYKFHSNGNVNNNIYILCEAILITLLFKKLGILKTPKNLYQFIIVLLILCWAAEIFIFGKLSEAVIYFRIIYSFIIVMMSVNYLNVLIGSSKKLYFKNSDFLLCLSFILYFTYKILVQSFWLYGLNSGISFLLKISAIMIYINLIANLIYALAVLWMPSKIEYSQPY